MGKVNRGACIGWEDVVAAARARRMNRMRERMIRHSPIALCTDYVFVRGLREKRRERERGGSRIPSPFNFQSSVIDHTWNDRRTDELTFYDRSVKHL